MTDQNSKTEESEVIPPEAFPFPKIIQTFNFFFPREKGAPDIFTMENLRKFARFAPYFTLGLLAIIFASFIRDHIVTEKIRSNRYALYFIIDGVMFIVIFLQYLWWLGASLLAKIVKRSPAVPLAMSFFDPLRFFAGLCIIHILGFIFGGLASLAK